MQMKGIPPGNMSKILQIRSLFDLKDLDHQVGIDHTDHLSEMLIIEKTALYRFLGRYTLIKLIKSLKGFVVAHDSFPRFGLPAVAAMFIRYSPAGSLQAKRTLAAHGITGRFVDMDKVCFTFCLLCLRVLYYVGLPRCVRCWWPCLLYTSPSPRDRQKSRMPSSA